MDSIAGRARFGGLAWGGTYVTTLGCGVLFSCVWFSALSNLAYQPGSNGIHGTYGGIRCPGKY